MIQLKLRGYIGKGEDISLNKIKNQLNHTSHDEEVIIFIDSEGGDIDEAFDIYNYLKPFKKLKTVVVNKAYSAATIIALTPKSIKNRTINDDAKWLIHLPFISNKGMCNLDACNADYLQMATDYVKERQDKLINFYVGIMNQDYESVKTTLKDNKEVDSLTCEALGFCMRAKKYNNSKNYVYNYIEKFNKNNLIMFDKIKAYFGFRVKNQILTTINGEEVIIENPSPEVIEGGKIYYSISQKDVEDGHYDLEGGLMIDVFSGLITKAIFTDVTPIEEVIEPELVAVDAEVIAEVISNEIEVNIEKEPTEETIDPLVQPEEIQPIEEKIITAEVIATMMENDAELKTQVENKILSNLSKGDSHEFKAPIVNYNNKNNQMTQFSINQEKLVAYAEDFFAVKNYKKADGTFYVRNNALTNGLSYTYNGLEDIESLVYSPTIATSNLSDICDVRYRVTAGAQLFRANALNDVVRAGSATCVVTESTSAGSITSRKLDTFLLQVDHTECAQVFQNTILAQYQGNPNSFNLEGSKLEEILLNILRDALRRDLAKLVAFGDSTSLNASFNAMDGMWIKLIAGVTAGDVVKVDTITALAVSNPTANSEYYLRRMYDGQSDEFASIEDAEKIYLVTRNVYQNYLNMLETRTATEAAMGLTIDGKKELTFRGVPVKPMYEWSKNLAASPIAPLDTLMLLTTKKNHVIGFDGNSEGLEVDFFYDKTTRQNKMRAALKIGYNYVDGLLNIVSYGNI